jgi:hypothetical protein
MCPVLNACTSQSFAARKVLSNQQFHPNPSSVTDGFDIWWQKTFAQHMAVVAEMSALVLAHRRNGSAGRTRPEQAH